MKRVWILVGLSAAQPLMARSPGSSLNMLHYEDLSQEQQIELARNRLMLRSGLPWARLALTDSYEPSESLRAALAERRAARWAWYGEEWGSSTAAALSSRSAPVVRYRQHGGNVSFPESVWWSNKVDERFFAHGPVNIAKASYFTRENRDKMQNFYNKGTASLEGYARALHHFRELLDAAHAANATAKPEHRLQGLKLRITARPRQVISQWLLDDYFAQVRKDRANTRSAAAKTAAAAVTTTTTTKKPWFARLFGDGDDDDEDSVGGREVFVDIYGPERSFDPEKWLDTYVLKKVSLDAMKPLCQLLRSIAMSMRHWELQKSAKYLHPTYLFWVNIPARESILANIEADAAALLDQPLDYTVTGRKAYFRSLRDLVKAVEPLRKLYNEIGDGYGREHYRGSKKALGPASETLRVSSIREQKTGRRMVGLLKSVPEKILAASTPRYDGVEDSFQTVAPARPKLDLKIRVERFGSYELEVGNWTFDSSTTDAATRLKFKSGTSELLKTALDTQIIPQMINALSTQAQAAYAKPAQEITHRVTLRSELLCFYDAQVGKARMLELLEASIPTLERDQKENDWLTAGVIFDSWKEGLLAGRDLLEQYLKTRHAQTSRFKYRPTDLDMSEVCDLNELSGFLIQHISAEGPKKSRVAPSLTLIEPEAQSPNEDSSDLLRNQRQIYRTCLNVAPPKTKVFIEGNPIPGVPKPSALSEMVNSMTGSVIGKIGPKKFTPAFSFAQVESYDVPLDLNLAREAARKIAQPAREAERLRKVRDVSQQAILDAADAAAGEMLEESPEPDVVRLPEFSFVPADVYDRATPPPVAEVKIRQAQPSIYAYTECRGGEASWAALERITETDFRERKSRQPSLARLRATAPEVFSL